MTTQELRRGLSSAAWGYFLLNFDFRVGTVSILPTFVGWLLFLSAIRSLSGARRSLTLLRPLCLLLAVWNAVEWLLSWLGQTTLNERFLFPNLLTSAAGLYFHYQFLTDLAALAQQFQPEDKALDAPLRRRRTEYTVLITAAVLISVLMDRFPLQRLEGLVLIPVLAACILSLVIMVNLFQLQRYLELT